ncbi:unnamed protein product [Penicillium salamii]|uniref:Uncharacterized protein n=1 Tax=Penicillium salamii TaxID=1612424 RepID=A0A9W4NII7_9EURO|nr:unnamed protein product [Penicillium salamii]CAG8187575.1 unnamed protein product [Penicillium salamii]CAG8263974.1 unnamed protein product [Penicillium salamii]CAG8312366.1 unnamed protein product [Penicillium salamii]CAG8370983.1 unnamed protein product [Penicillium salamii]
MKLTAVLLFLATACAEHQHRRDTTDNGINIGAVSSALAHMTANQTASANFGNISSPPRSLIGEILSAVPVSVIWELINPEQRKSLASQFNAGTTPAWYSALPTDVKSYMSVVRSQISDGALTATTGAYAKTATQTQTQSQAQSTSATGADSQSASSSSSSSSTSTSSSAAAPTELTVSVMGALSVLGLALAL